MTDVRELVSVLKERIEKLDLVKKPQETGRVVAVGDGIANIYGLRNVEMSETVRFQSGTTGMVLNLNTDSVDAIVFGPNESVGEGDSVERTGELVEVPVGRDLLGRVVNGLGEPIDGAGPIKSKEQKKVDVVAPGIITRQEVTEPLQTGIKAIDLLIPIGRGQRELIIGDRQTGKTSIAVDVIINQARINNLIKDKSKRVYCVYVGIGQKESTVARIVNSLTELGAMQYTTVVSAAAADPAAEQYLAPYVGCTIGEYFRDKGEHALVVYDDLSKHAVAYRQLSLLLRRPPGREAYPGDVFYLHSRLLERAAKLSDKLGGGSLSALPLVETQAGDISSYIPTNVISITDGQIYLNTGMFYRGQRPAIDVGLSVSRVGSAAQTKLIKKVAGSLKGELAQYRDLEAFAQFASDLDQVAQKTLSRGQRLMLVLRQRALAPVSMGEEAVLIYSATHGFLDDVPLEKVFPAAQTLVEVLRADHAEFMLHVEETADLTEDIERKIQEILTNFFKTLT